MQAFTDTPREEEPILNAMTIDVEDYFHVQAFAPYIEPESWDRLESRVERNTSRLLGILDEHNVRATFFVLGWVAERYPGVVRRIAAAGHEIACHGYSHRLIYTQSPEVFREETHRAKALLEDLVQRPVAGYRAASYSITRASLWALDILAELGFRYDSSIFPTHHDNYGIPDARRDPHVLRTPAGHRLVEFPPSTLPLGAYRLPVAGGGYFRLYPYAFTRRALARINARERMPFIFYLHPWEVDPDQPRVSAGWRSRFRHYNNLSRCEARLRRLLGEFRFATAHEVLVAQGLLAPAVIARRAAALA